MPKGEGFEAVLAELRGPGKKVEDALAARKLGQFAPLVFIGLCAVAALIDGAGSLRRIADLVQRAADEEGDGEA